MKLPPQHWSTREYVDNLLVPNGRVVTAMERTGIPVDPDRLRAIEADMLTRANEIRADLTHWANGLDVNWQSWQQLAAFLHGKVGEGGLELEPSPYCKKGEVPDDKISTDDRALEWLAGHNPAQREHIQKLRTLRTCERMRRYARDWLAVALPFGDGSVRLHPQFGLASDQDTRPGARTGRYGVKNPALNQVPRNTSSAGDLGIPKDPAGMRSAFIPPPGMRLIVVDYSQLEIVILAHLIALLFSDQDPLVVKVRAGQDIHGPLAQFVFGELAQDESVRKAPLSDFKKVPLLKLYRDLAKAGIYGNNYGKGEHGFATSTFLPTGEPLGPERAHLLVEGMRRFYPGVTDYQGFVRDWIGREGYIMSLFGRWYPLPNARHPKQGMRNRAWRQALNYPMQAGGQEIMALALIAIFEDPLLRELGFVLSLVVHDEIVGWAPEATCERALARVEEIMVSVVELLCPLKAEGGHGLNWKDTKK